MCNFLQFLIKYVLIVVIIINNNIIFMNLNEKKVYIVKLLMWIWIKEEKILFLSKEIDKKKENELDKFIIELESYYKKENILNKDFINTLNKINNKIDESIEKTIENFNINNKFNF